MQVYFAVKFIRLDPKHAGQARQAPPFFMRFQVLPDKLDSKGHQHGILYKADANYTNKILKVFILFSC